MEIEPLDWAGVLEPSMLSEAVVAARHRLADAARAGDWDGVLTLLRGGSTMLYTTFQVVAELSGKGWKAPRMCIEATK